MTALTATLLSLEVTMKNLVKTHPESVNSNLFSLSLIKTQMLTLSQSTFRVTISLRRKSTLSKVKSICSEVSLMDHSRAILKTMMVNN